jgi:asparagine synthase (glutamine-hydrolysing)
VSGIAGLWNLDGRPVDEALLAAIGSRQAHRGPDGEGHWVRGSVGLTCQILRATPESASETLPLVHCSGLVAVFDGRLDNREDLLSSLSAPGLCRESPDAAFVLAAYNVHGEQFVEHLNGDFALGLFDPRLQRLLLARDAIGIKPLHYCRIRGAFVFASEVKSLFAHPRVTAAPSDDALADFLLRGYSAEGRTFFKDVFSVPPAHLAVLTPERFVTRQYWDFDTSRQERTGSFHEYADEFTDHFARAVRRRLRTSRPAAVSVSGGLDSSSIFCVAQGESRQVAGLHAPVGLSYTSPAGSPADEQHFLLDIERAYGVAIDRIPGGVPGVMGQSRNELWHVEAPLLDALGNRLHGLLGAAHQRGARVLLTGHWGDQVLCERSYLVDLARRFRWVNVWRHLREYPRWYADVDSPGFTRAFFREFIRLHAPGALVATVRRLRMKARRPTRRVRWYTDAFSQRPPGPDTGPATGPGLRRSVSGRWRSSAHAQSLYREVRNSYHVLCMELNDKAAAMYGLEMAFPFLDRDLLSFLMAIPGDMQTWRGIPKAFLREGLRGIVPEPILARRGKADFTDLVNVGMERELPQLAECLRSPGLAIRLGYVKQDATFNELNHLKGRIEGPDCSVAWALQEILSLELWLQVFFGTATEAGDAMDYAR